MCKKVYATGMTRTINCNETAGVASTGIIVFDVMSNGTFVPQDINQLTPCFHMAKQGNEKVGHEIRTISEAIAPTCRDDAGCKCQQVDDGEKKAGDPGWCYGCMSKNPSGKLQPNNFSQNTVIMQRWETYLFVNQHSVGEIMAEIERKLSENPADEIRFYEVGDFRPKMVKVAVCLAYAHEDMFFYGYTKKYSIWNNHVKANGGSYEKAIPKNLHIEFSECPGLPMDNPYHFPVSVYLPADQEVPELREGLDKLCPCSDPLWGETCHECGWCVKEVPEGGRTILKAHSLPETKKIDALINKGHKISRKLHKAELRLEKALACKKVNQARVDALRAEIKALALEKACLAVELGLSC